MLSKRLVDRKGRAGDGKRGRRKGAGVKKGKREA